MGILLFITAIILVFLLFLLIRVRIRSKNKTLRGYRPIAVHTPINKKNKKEEPSSFHIQTNDETTSFIPPTASSFLASETLLKKGEYRIIGLLGQGGFGITYLAVQTGLNRKVTIKEFFMKEYCDRETTTSSVIINSQGSKELVASFRKKFIKEAQMIAELRNKHTINIIDIFEERETVYYVMEYIAGGSLKDLVEKNGALPEDKALPLIYQIADALDYIHKRNITHLDVKPSNILLDEDQNAILIDFGISKHYDQEGGQTSNTPVGISKGFTPLEQYRQDGINKFSPCTDIYSLGATFYYLLTGKIPPEAAILMNNGFPEEKLYEQNVSKQSINAIRQAMSPMKKARPQSIGDFLKNIDNNPNEEKENKLNDGHIIKVKTSTSRILFYFTDASVPPEYHRSYEASITCERIDLKVSCYGNILNTESVPLTVLQYTNLLNFIDNLKLIISPPKDDQGMCGGTTIALELYEDDTMYDSGYNYANSYGTLFGDVQRLKLEIEKLIPDFQNKLKL